jgi:hypothetical protein
VRQEQAQGILVAALGGFGGASRIRRGQAGIPKPAYAVVHDRFQFEGQKSAVATADATGIPKAFLATLWLRSRSGWEADLLDRLPAHEQW